MRLLFLESGDWGLEEDGEGGLDEKEFELLSVSELWGSLLIALYVSDPGSYTIICSYWGGGG